ncbi:hypothetical protein I350_02962 [Cryptococcus amylolentus CBS 6273]|uniref:Xylanolytic transcriptional activator regulatory domain-containing protein n=1 Tax=Cryptococcus amylolentus CBS 6273 TaxID=1296118 RepID=A0A1E3KAP5_9TREE|nr:hypothetical protein I350_02962 [Cryptococcus amylolentus CBS 6273]
MQQPQDPPVSRKRSSRACDACKTRRSKCEELRENSDGTPSCKACREEHKPISRRLLLTLIYRGPARGFKHGVDSSSAGAEQQQQRPLRPQYPLATGRPGPANLGHQERSTLSSSRTQSPPPSTSGSAHRPPLRPNEPFFGIPTHMVDQLLAVYFTHVHNVWPLVCKPVFSPHNISAHLLLSMLAVAICVAPECAVEGFHATSLFHMAEHALLQRRNEIKVDIIQSFILMSLRQTGCGDKQSAALYANRASVMATTMGLHLDQGSSLQNTPDYENDTRSRVYWNCYVLDKVVAEETGRPYVLPYRRSSVPFPGIGETDELETWPPAPMSSALVPVSVRHVTPRRGYVMSCFVWTCRLAMIVEEIMELQLDGPCINAASNAWDRQFVQQSREKRDPDEQRDMIARQLELWKAALPPHLDVDTNSPISPMPHHVVGITWYHTARILLFSRFLRRRPASSPVAGETERSKDYYAICSNAAQAVVDLIHLLDTNRVLQHVSSDLIHLLSLTTLFEAYDSVSTDPARAHRAKINFSQCCIWLKEFSSSWPAASSHRVFFEGLIMGGMQLSEPEVLPASTREREKRPSDASSAVVVGEGIQRVHRHLSGSDNAASATSSTITSPQFAFRPPRNGTTDVSPANLFQLPQYYWNQLSVNDEPLQSQPRYTHDYDFNLYPSSLQYPAAVSPTDQFVTGPSPVSQTSRFSPEASLSYPQQHLATRPQWDPMQREIPQGSMAPNGGRSSSQYPSVPPPSAPPGPPTGAGENLDAVHSALMAYMMDAMKGGGTQ